MLITRLYSLKHFANVSAIVGSLYQGTFCNHITRLYYYHYISLNKKPAKFHRFSGTPLTPFGHDIHGAATDSPPLGKNYCLVNWDDSAETKVCCVVSP